MKKSLIALSVLAACAQGYAATTYRDRFIPGGICMIEFNKVQINANLISEVSVDKRRWYKFEGLLSGNVEQPPYTSLRVYLVNGQHYEIKDGDLIKQQNDFIKKIKDECR